MTYDPDHTTDLEKNLGSYYGTLLGTTTPDSLPNSFLTSIDASPLSVIPQLQEFLCHIYLAQVDPVFKILHRPSLRALLLEEKPYLHYDLNHPAPAALKCAVFYAAACSISEVNWPTMMGSSRPAVLARYQSETEAALRRAEYITTNDLTVLQAFVLSLVSIKSSSLNCYSNPANHNGPMPMTQLCARSHDQSRRSWTMLSMAVRIAQALCLHIPRPTFAVSPFEKEMRRRLWIAIGLLDVQASLDRASEPMILTSWLQFHPPSNINDEDVSASFQGPVQQSEDFTDTTFALMVLKAQCTARLLNVGDTAESPAMALHTRQLYVVDFQRTRYQLLRNCRPESDSFHWYAGQVADCIDASLQLIALRPLQRNAKLIAPSPTRGLRILKLSVDVLQKTQILYDDIRGRPWRWFEGIFVPWHALAVALAELCELEGPAAMMETYWLPVKQAFDRFGSLVADSQQGMLWKPMEKLMTQARRKRNLQLADSLLSSRVLSLGSEDVASSAASDWNSPFLILTPMEAEGDEEQDQGTPIITSGDDLGSWPDSWNLPCTIDWPSDLLAPMNG